MVCRRSPTRQTIDGVLHFDSRLTSSGGSVPAFGVACRIILQVISAGRVVLCADATYASERDASLTWERACNQRSGLVGTSCSQGVLQEPWCCQVRTCHGQA